MPGLVTTRSVGRSAARAGIEAAVAAAQELGCRCCIAVVDMAGETVSYDRMDGAPFNSAPQRPRQGGLGGRQRHRDE